MPELWGMKTPYPRAMTFRGKMVNIVLAVKIFERRIPLILSASRERKILRKAKNTSSKDARG